MNFKLHAPYRPTGDQPEAIRQLVTGIQNEYKDQVLLGATGTGKSLSYEDRVYVIEQYDGQCIPRLLPIGELVETAMLAAPERIRTVGDSQILDLPPVSDRLNGAKTYLCQAVDPVTCQVGLYPVSAFTRHSSPADLYRVQTACGRLATLTGDHNLWVLRAGRMQLLRTTDVCPGDSIPVPERLLTVCEVNSTQTIPLSAPCPVAPRPTPALLRLLGLTIAEASVRREKLRYLNLTDFVYRDLQAVFEELEIAYSFVSRQGLQIEDAAWTQVLLTLCGAAHHTRHLPPFWPQLDDRELGHLLGGYFDGDGYLTRQASILTSTTSSDLAQDLAYALLRLGIRARLARRFKPAANSHEAGHWHSYVSIRGGIELNRFQEVCDFRTPHKHAALHTYLEKHQRGDVSNLPTAPICSPDTLCWTPITALESVPASHPYVYDLTVPGPETFLAGQGGFFVHNTFTIASVIEQINMPALVMAHNKTLAAQLYAEFREFFPDNAVEYFVSYYDYYQPEAYVPRHDLYIEKDSDINEEIERLRLAATTALMSRRDVIIVASVSCIYGIGNPEAYGRVVINLESGKIYRRNALLRQLIEGHYQRNDLDLRPGTFRVRGDSLDVIPAYQEKIGYRITFFGDEIERMIEFDATTGELKRELHSVAIYPARHFITDEDKLKQAIQDIETELSSSVAQFKAQERLLEAQRIEQRTQYDLEMLREVGYCSGIENYSRHMDQRPVGSPPWTLMDYLPHDYLLVIDESHMTIPQIRGMFNGDRNRKKTLVEYGFRLPSALDNRPLTFEEYESRMGYTIYTSATPAAWEMQRADQVVEQIIRPTGLVDPQVEVRPIEGQIDNLIKEIRQRIERGERTLVTTLTKRMAEKLADYLLELGIKVHYLHSEIDTLERIGILRDLRLGVFDVIVGINLLREGLDLPEVSLVAILDADKEGFLRSDTALIQTIGRAARHINGKVIMYADVITDSMRRAIDETERRRAKQIAYNEEHHIQPVSIFKAVRDLTDQLSLKVVAEPQGDYQSRSTASLPKNEIKRVVAELEKQMKEAAKNLEFEQAAALRDQIYELRKVLADESSAKPWEKVRLLAGEEE